MCADFGARLVECNGEDDHVHLLVSYPPQVAVSRLVNSLKGVSSRRLQQHYRVRTHREHLWSPAARSGEREHQRHEGDDHRQSCHVGRMVTVPARAQHPRESCRPESSSEW